MTDETKPAEQKPLRAIDRATEHYSAWKKRPIRIPEWTRPGEDVFTVYCIPSTIAQRRLVASKHGLDQLEIATTIILRNVVDVNGNQIFDEPDRDKLKREVSDAIIERFNQAIFPYSLLRADVEDAEKN